LVVNLYIIITINVRLKLRSVVFCTYDDKSPPHIAAIMTGDPLSSTCPWASSRFIFLMCNWPK
ncbi:hypothetical protein, partial [Erwinia amylovora]|uniref:hypothetical protein n=1 Tax=Erwinia amylovora TaxID=552 RepID=UPI001964F23F